MSFRFIDNILVNYIQSIMYKVLLGKVIRDTPLLKKGQKVWLMNGYAAICCSDRSGYALGKYRGNGRWINVWVHCGNPEWKRNGSPDTKLVGEVVVSEAFLKYLLQKERIYVDVGGRGIYPTTEEINKQLQNYWHDS